MTVAVSRLNFPVTSTPAALEHVVTLTLKMLASTLASLIHDLTHLAIVIEVTGLWLPIQERKGDL